MTKKVAEALKGTGQNEKAEGKEDGLEELFGQLEETVRRMEEEEVSLEESFQLYHKGMDVLKKCNDRIDEVEKKMLILDEEGGVHEF